mgnify:CR=1 FL=1
MAINQSQLARELGLSQGTVSVALGGSGRISERTRRRVLKAVHVKGYQPNRLASSLRRGKTASLGVIWAFADPWAGDAVIALDLLERMQGQGYAVFQAQHSPRTQVLCDQLDDMLGRQVEGIVIQAVPSQLADERVARRLKSAKAVVGVTREPVPDFPGDLVVHDRGQAICEVVDHLVSRGRQRLAMALSIGQESNPSKFDAFLARCKTHGLPRHPHELIPLDAPKEPETHGLRHEEAVRRAFPDDGPVPVDAIFCFNDIGALCVIRELTRRGIRVPEEVAVIGFNNTEAGRVWQPALASGDRRPREVSQAVYDLLNDRLENGRSSNVTRVVPMRFVWRESAG